MWHSLAIQEGLGTRTLAQAVENAKGHVGKRMLRRKQGWNTTLQNFV